jgi:hypothetical protein
MDHSTIVPGRDGERGFDSIMETYDHDTNSGDSMPKVVASGGVAGDTGVTQSEDDDNF